MENAGTQYAQKKDIVMDEEKEVFFSPKLMSPQRRMRESSGG
jgi:hypothetical protein